jgi:putative addiction module component (TIGR02574 family)
MSRTAVEILEDARQLPPSEVDWLIESLLISEKSETDEAVEAAWDSEIKRRLDEIDSGAVKLVPLEDVLARMDARLLARQRG